QFEPVERGHLAGDVGGDSRGESQAVRTGVPQSAANAAGERAVRLPGDGGNRGSGDALSKDGEHDQREGSRRRARKSPWPPMISSSSATTGSSGVIFPEPRRRWPSERLLSMMMRHSPSFSLAGDSSAVPLTPSRYLLPLWLRPRYQPQSSWPGGSACMPRSA